MKTLLVCAKFIALSAVTSHAALVANWDFNDATDSVSSTVGTVVSSSTISGGKLNLTGTGGFDSNTDGGLGGTGSFTVAAEFTTSFTSGAQTIFSYTPSTTQGGGALRLLVQPNGNLRIEMNSGAGFEANLGTLNLNDGLSHRVAAIFDSSLGNSFLDVDLFVNGTMYNVAGGTDHTINLGNTVTEDDEVSFGYQLHSTATSTFTGAMDFVQIHNTALTAGQLAAIPEPAATLLGALGLLTLLRRRR